MISFNSNLTENAFKNSWGIREIFIMEYECPDYNLNCTYNQCFECEDPYLITSNLKECSLTC